MRGPTARARSVFSVWRHHRGILAEFLTPARTESAWLALSRMSSDEAAYYALQHFAQRELQRLEADAVTRRRAALRMTELRADLVAAIAAEIYAAGDRRPCA